MCLTITVILLLLTVAIVNGSYLPIHPVNVTADVTSNSANASYHYEYDYYLPEISEQLAESLTEEKVKILVIRELVKFIKGNENIAVVNDIVQKEGEKKRNCSLKVGPNYYYDRVVDDCRSCLDRDCQKNEICAWECRDILKIKGLEEEINDTVLQLENFEKAVTELQSDNFSFKVWNASLSVLVVVLFVAFGVLFCYYKDLRRRSSMKAVPAHYDVEKLIQPVQDSASTLASNSTGM